MAKPPYGGPEMVQLPFIHRNAEPALPGSGAFILLFRVMNGLCSGC
jgi:hypothetical protein